MPTLGSCWRQALKLARRYSLRRLSSSIVLQPVPLKRRQRRVSPSTVLQLAPVWRVYRLFLLQQTLRRLSPSTVFHLDPV